MKTLFICKGNWYRSQIAEALYNQLTHSTDATSAGTYPGFPGEPEGQLIRTLLPHQVLTVLESYGLHIQDNTTKKVTPEMLRAAEVVVCMAEDPFIPDFIRSDARVIYWNVPDDRPAEETYQKIKGLINRQLL